MFNILVRTILECLISNAVKFYLLFQLVLPLMVNNFPQFSLHLCIFPHFFTLPVLVLV